MMMGGLGWIGGVEYVRNLVLALGQLPNAERKTFELCLVVKNESDSNTYRQLIPYLDKILSLDKDLPRETFLNGLYWKYLRDFKKLINPRLYDFLKREEFDFVYPYFETSNRKGAFAWATWIPDFQHKHLPQYFSSVEIVERDEDFSRRIRSSTVLVLSSKSAASDLENFFPGAARPKILSFRTSPNPDWLSGNPEEVQKKYNLSDKFFIVCNQLWQHKNHLLMFEALGLLKKRDMRPIIVCTGHFYDSREPNYIDRFLQLINMYDLHDQVILLGLLPKNEQIQLLRRSIAVIQPSLFEGWSTIVEDARCIGKPMILSDIPVHLEQNPPCGRFFQRTSPESLAEVMAEFWQNMVPGPDLGSELKAGEESKSEVLKFAREFIEIAKDTYVQG